MTRVLKAIPTLLTAFGASLPTATKDHRGQFVWKRASGAEDEIHAGVVDSSNVAQFRRILTKTYADTVYVPLIQASAVSPYTQAPSIADSAVTASTSDTANYSVNVTMSFTLPTGTWAVYAWAAGLFSHSSANGIVRVHLQVGDDLGTALTSPVRPIRAAPRLPWRITPPGRPARSRLLWNTGRTPPAPPTRAAAT